MNIGEILKQYLPRASREDIEAAGETVLKRIRHMRFQAEAAAAGEEEDAAKNTPDAGWLHDFHIGLLMAVEELQGYGKPVSITLKMEEILEEPMGVGHGSFSEPAVDGAHGPGLLVADRSRQAEGIGSAILRDHALGTRNDGEGARAAATSRRSRQAAPVCIKDAERTRRGG